MELFIPPYFMLRSVSSAATPIWLGHGASGGPETMSAYISGLKKLKLDAHALSLPRGSAERAMKPLRDQVGSQFDRAVIGGHSFGGRVASIVASETAPAGLILLSYPLHRPGHPEDLRTAHWRKITCPVLLLSGDSDQFARIDLLGDEVAKLRSHQLHVYHGLRHGLLKVSGDVCERIAEFVAGL
jgi:pimeloyl-ACP methyl ester carboxylesterase